MTSVVGLDVGAAGSRIGIARNRGVRASSGLSELTSPD